MKGWLMNMKKNYQIPEISLITVANEDVLTLSLVDKAQAQGIFVKNSDKTSWDAFQ